MSTMSITSPQNQVQRCSRLSDLSFGLLDRHVPVDSLQIRDQLAAKPGGLRYSYSAISRAASEPRRHRPERSMSPGSGRGFRFPAH
jgi:hypothetical protein